ncbi:MULTISPECIES: NAD(P)H-quinone oxidoreductase [Rhodanobacteraceae]|uniref:NAD(P)H-quinone oxidoreductase n=1 Tax=Rhodanobacteraceae TaxID=1775411 RepID=UPI00088147FC|nr:MULTISPECIES: NAD(P)H-quinone oxidoreductase [Rhodanobacteraceae]SDF64707.1 putative NAD(P)H quinone oxidoreductase, PIG3 family [Dyella sp. 333MFSha]SKB62106.1 putative NAD(P)H quinone oxidoreductase, PIG3 family [Luteibacter sp. 22Crub2.1]
MKAITFDQFGDADVLHLTDVDQPVARDDDLLVRVHAAGVNRADIIQRNGGYKGESYGDSEIMGLEIAGEIIAIGRNVHGHAVGDRVMGIVGGGAYAEVARIDHRMAMTIPDRLGYVEAAAIPEAFVTAHEAAFHLGRVESMDSILIHAGASGVGSAAIQLARAAGARVFATASGGKLDRVRGFGAGIAIDYRSDDFAEVVARETDKRGVDVIVDFIGAPYFERNLASLSHGGRLVQVGLLGGSNGATLPLDQLLYRHLQIIGTVMKSRPAAVKQAMTRRFRERWLHRFADGTLSPVVDSEYPLSQAAEAHRHMESGQSTGKIILTM